MNTDADSKVFKNGKEAFDYIIEVCDNHYETADSTRDQVKKGPKVRLSDLGHNKAVRDLMKKHTKSEFKDPRYSGAKSKVFEASST